MDQAVGLMILSSNYRFTNIKDTDAEIEITTVSDVQLAEQLALEKAGWVRRAHNVYAFVRPSRSVTEDVYVPEEEALESEETTEPPLEDEPPKVIVEEDVPDTPAGVMDDV